MNHPSWNLESREKERELQDASQKIPQLQKRGFKTKSNSKNKKKLSYQNKSRVLKLFQTDTINTRHTKLTKQNQMTERIQAKHCRFYNKNILNINNSTTPTSKYFIGKKIFKKENLQVEIRKRNF